MPLGMVKVCKVCSDKANGYNFNAITCESCKAFFRRNANKSDCSFQDNCVIEVKTRRFCQKCRLDKCFKVGMKREWILTEEQKKQKRAKILENKMKKAATGSNRSSSELASNHEDNLSNSDIADDPSFLEVSNDFDDLAEFLDPDRALVSVLDLNADKNMMSPSFSPPPEQAISPQPFTTSVPSKMANFPDSSQQIENLSIDTRSVRLHQRILETNFTPIFLRSNRSSNGGPLNELEDYKLQELIEAWRTVDEPLFMEDYSEITDPIKLVYLSDIMIKRLIAWCKQIQSFRNRCQDDQIALLKGGCLEMMLMSASINFDLSRDCWVDKYTGFKVSADILKKAEGDLALAHRKFIEDFKPRWRQDQSVILLMVAIALFNPRANLRHANTVRLEQASYEYLLRRYLESQYPDDMCQATSDYLELIGKLEDLHELTLQHIKFYLNLGPQAIGPLLLEILNLNQSQIPMIA